MTRESELTAELVVRAYTMGAFPMAHGRGGKRIEWFSPDPRAVLPLEPGGMHVPRSLARRVRSGRFQITHDQAFERVIRACSEPRPREPETWINESIVQVYTQLHRAGLAHSVEAWQVGEPGQAGGAAEPTARLVGGLYGVALGGAFFGESMFSRATDASKVCLVHLVEHLRGQGFELLDVQFVNPHLQQFGVVQIPRETYLRRLREAITKQVSW